MWHQVFFLSFVASLGVISATLCAPALPVIAHQFSAEVFSVQFIISLFLIGNAFGQIFSGPLSDRFGQRNVLLGGLFLYVLASYVCALSQGLFSLICARFFQGMGAAVGPVLARAISASKFSQDKSAEVQSYGALGVGVASMFAIVCGGFLATFSWRGCFWLATLIGGASLIWAFFVLERCKKKRPSIALKYLFKEMGKLLKNPFFFGHALCHAFSYGLMYGYIALFPFLLDILFQESRPEQVGIYSAWMIGCYMAGAFFAARVVLRWTAIRLVWLGMCAQLVSGVILCFSFIPSLFWAGLILYNFCMGILLPTTAALALAPFKESPLVGVASSSLAIFYRLVGTLISTGIGFLPLAGGRNLALTLTLLSGAGLCVLRWMDGRAVEELKRKEFV